MYPDCYIQLLDIRICSVLSVIIHFSLMMQHLWTAHKISSRENQYNQREKILCDCYWICLLWNYAGVEFLHLFAGDTMEFNALKEISEYICRVPYIHEYPLVKRGGILQL